MANQIDPSSDRTHVPVTCIPNPDEFPTIPVAVAARLAGVARRTGYAAAQRGEWPVIRTGRAVRVRTRQFLQQCGLLEEAQ
ncbi:hypothetical protein ABZ669_14680 [Streptomyces hirsutus]|uniref:hypothetical protein n=1 Tax=Streptomyces hirsutus TaxID=35620 RepID=UPI0034087EA0